MAGCNQQTIFSTSVLQQLYQYTGGVPRLINLIADRALLGAYASDRTSLTAHVDTIVDIDCWDKHLVVATTAATQKNCDTNSALQACEHHAPTQA